MSQREDKSQLEPSNPLQIQHVGIALAGYNPPIGVFAEQLKSIKLQTFQSWTCWITLDSPLKPLQEAPELKPYFEDTRFRWSENSTRLGHKKNFERAMYLAASDPKVVAIACSDQDDVWYPNKLQRCVDELQSKGPNSLVHSDMHVLNADGSIASQTGWQLEHRGVHNATVETLLIRNVVAGCAMLIDANLVRKWPIIPEALDYHDHWYAVVAAAHRGAHPIYEPLYAYRQHGGNVVGVSAFNGVFNISKELRTIEKFATKLRNTNTRSLEIASTVLNANLPDKSIRPISKYAPKSFARAVALLALGTRNFFSDPSLARSSLARGIGALLQILGYPAT